MKVSKAVYVRKCDFIAELNRDYQYYATNIVRDGDYTPETSRYEEKTHAVGCQYDCKRDNRICTCRNPSPVRRRQEVRYFGSPKQIYAYQGSRSFTEIGVGSVKALQRKKVKRIYLPETSERGVGSSDLSSYILGRNKQHRSCYYETKRTSSKCVGGLLECNPGCVMNEKLSPIVQTISGSTSYRESIVNRNIEIGSSSVVKNITNTTTQVEKASKKDCDMKTEAKVEEIIQPILIIHDDQTEMKNITSRRTSERKPIEKTSSSDSLLQHVHNLENPSDEPTSHLSLEADDLMENKLEIEYRSIFAAKSKSKDSKYSAEKPTSELKSTSTLKRRFEALRRGLVKKDDSKKNAVIVSKISSQVSGQSRKDVSINSDPPSLEGRSFSNTKPYAPCVTRYSRDKTMYNPRTSHYRRAVTNKKERTSADWSSKAVDDDSEGQGVKGMFKLWGKKFNFEDDHYKSSSPKLSYTSPRRSPKKRIDTPKVQAKTFSKPDDMMMDEKKEGRKFFFFKKKNKEKPYKTKKGVTTGRCEVRDGLVIKILGGNVYDPTDIDKDTEMDDDSYEEIIRKSWLKKFLTPSIDSRNSVKIRWNNKRYAPSSSTVFELMDNIYKDSSEIFRSKSQVTVQSSHKSYTRQHYGFVRQNIEAWMIPKTITDRPKLIPVKQLKQQQQRSYKSDEDRKDNMEVRISDQKWFIDKSKAFSHKIEVVLHSKNFRKLNKEESSEYLRIDIPKGFFVDSSSDDNHRPTNQSSDEEVYKIVEYETASDLKKDKAACNFNIGDHKQNKIKVTVSVKESKKCVSKVLETINRQPTSRDVVIQGSNVLIPKRCDVIGVGIITQRDLSQIRKPILKIQDDFSDEESEHNILRPHGKKCEFAESYLQEYYRHWTPLGIDLYSWCVSDSQLKCCSEHSRSSYVYPGVVTKSCPNILDDFQTSAIVSSCGNPSCSQCQYKQQDCSKPPPPPKCAWFKNKKKSGKNGVETRVCPKDSIEVFKARKIYAATLKAKWCSPCMDAEQPEDCEQRYPMSPESKSAQNLPTTECPKLMKPCCRPVKPKPKPAPFKKHVSMPDCEEMNETLAKQLSSTMPESILQFKGVKPTPPPCEVCQKPHADPKHATINSVPSPGLSPTCLPTCVKPPDPCTPPSPCKPCPSYEKPPSRPATPPVCVIPPTPPCKKIPSCPPTPTPSKKPLRSHKKLKSPPPCPSTPPPCPKSPSPCPKSPPPCPNSPPPCPKSPPTCPPTPPSCPSCPPTPPSCPLTPPSGTGSPRSPSPRFSTPLVCPPNKPSSCPSSPKKPPCCTPPKKPPCCTPPKKPPCCTPPKKPLCCTPPKKPPSSPSPKKPSCCSAAPKSPCCPPSPKRSPTCPPTCPPTGPPTPKKPPCCPAAPKKPTGGCLKKPLICLTSPQKSRNGLTPPPCPRRLPCCSPDTPSMNKVPSFTPCPHIHIVECPPKPCPGLPPPPPPEICCCPPIRVKKPCPYTSPCPSSPPCPKPCPKPLCPLSPSCPPPPCSNCPFSSSQPPCPHTKSCPPCPPTSCVKKPKCPHIPPCPPPPCPPSPCSSPSCPPPPCPPKPCPPSPCYPPPCPPPPCPPKPCPLPFCPLPSCPPKPCFPPPCPPKPCFPPPCPPKPCFPPPCPPKPCPLPFCPLPSCAPKPCFPPPCPPPFCPPKPGCWKPLTIPSMCPSPISCCEMCNQPKMKPCITSFCRSLDCQQSSVTSISQAALHADAPLYYSPIHPCPPEPKKEPKKRDRCKTPPCKFDDDYPWPTKDLLSNSSSRCKNDCPMLPNMSCETIPSPVKQECRKSCPNYLGSPRLPCLSKLPEMQCPPVQTPPPLRLPSLSRLPTEPSKASGITIPSRSKSKVSGLHLKMMPAPPSKKPVCSTDCLTWDNDKQDDGCISLSSKEKITIRLKKDTPSTEEIREGFNIKVQDEDGMTLFERKDYRLQHAGVQRQSSLVGEVYKASEVRRVTTNSSDQALGTDKDNDKLKEINEVSSVASIANLIEIQFKLKVTQGDKVTEINISDDGENTSKKNYEHKATKQKSQEVFVVKNEPPAGQPDQNNDINIRIVIKNFKPKAGKKKTVNLSDDYSEFSKKISAKFHTVSTGYSDIFHDDNVFSVHRATVDLTSSVDNIKTIENNASVEVMSKPENELGGVILMGSECRCITTEMLEDKSEDTEAKSYPSRKYSASKEIQENQEETDTQLTDHKYEYNEDTDTEKPMKYDTEETDTDRQVDPPKYDTEETDTEKQADKKYDNMSTTDTDEPDALPEIKKSLSLDVLVKPQTKDEKKKLLKQVFEKVHDTKYKNKTRMRKLRDMLKVILTSDSSDRDDTKLATSELATDVTYASLKPNYFRDSDSMNNYYRVESNPVLPEAAINRQVVYPTMENNSDCSNSVHSVEVLSSEAESPKRGGCMCSTLAARLKLASRIGEGGGCCCGTKRMTKRNEETTCDLKRESDYLTHIDYKTNESMDVQTQNSRYLTSKINSTNLSVHDSLSPSIGDSVDDEVKADSGVLNVDSKKFKLRKTFSPEKCHIRQCEMRKRNRNAILSISDEDKIVFLSGHSTRVPIENVTVKAEKKNPLMRIDAADILQSYETKKAVLEIYTEKTISDDGEHLVAKLPKFVYDREQEIQANYEAMATNTYKTVCKKNIVMMAIKR